MVTNSPKICVAKHNKHLLFAYANSAAVSGISQSWCPSWGDSAFCVAVLEVPLFQKRLSWLLQQLEGQAAALICFGQEWPFHLCP